VNNDESIIVLPITVKLHYQNAKGRREAIRMVEQELLKIKFAGGGQQTGTVGAEVTAVITEDT
jgi:hypothetical protein